MRARSRRFIYGIFDGEATSCLPGVFPSLVRMDIHTVLSYAPKFVVPKFLFEGRATEDVTVTVVFVGGAMRPSHEPQERQPRTEGLNIAEMLIFTVSDSSSNPFAKLWPRPQPGL
jgi:hypothetical protein